MTDTREVIRCQACKLNQFVTPTMLCRRCSNPLQRFTVRSTEILYVTKGAGVPPDCVPTLRQVMQLAAIHAVKASNGNMTRAAAALRIHHSRLKQLLAEAGDNQDRRYWPKSKREG